VRLTGENLGNVIITKCHSLNLDLQKCVGQGMDGAANMRSEVRGAAATVRQEAPMALYFHCMMHCLNLCASQSVKVPSIRNCVDQVREMINFFSFSATRNHVLQRMIKEAHTDSIRLKKLCDTRFVEKHSSVLTILKLLPCLQATFEYLSSSDSQTRETSTLSNQHLAAVGKFEFLINLQALADTSGLLMIGVSRSLQTVGTDIIRALHEVKTLQNILDSMRINSEESFGKIFEAAENLANDMNVTVEKPRIAKRSVYRSGARTEDDSVSNYFRINMYIPLLDGLCSHLNDRFGPSQEKALSLMGLVPAYMTNDIGTLQPAIELYSCLLPATYEIEGEFKIWSYTWRDKQAAAEVKTALGALQSCHRGQTLPNIKILLQILATLPVTTAEPERVFSKVERTGTAIRNMEEARLEALVLLQSHLDRTPSVDNVLNTFALADARRLKLIL
jgi:hypothetical protein